MDGGRVITAARLLAAVVLSAAALLTLGTAARAAQVVVHTIPTGDSGPTSLVVGPGGNLYFAESNVFKIGVVNPAAPATIDELPLPVPAVSAGDGFDGPEYLASSGSQIWAITDDFEDLYAVGADGSLSPTLHWDGSDASGITADDAGGVWLFDKNASVNGAPAALQRVDPPPPTYPLHAFPTDDINQAFSPMTTSPDGHAAWYAEDTPGQVDLVSISDAGQIVKLPVPIVDQTYEITSLQFSSNGSLWFTEHAPLHLTFPVGGAIGVLPAGSSTPKIVWSQPDTDDNAPTSLTAGPGGSMYFAWSKGIGQITPSGQVTFGDLSPYTPSSVVDGPDGNLWFVDSQANSIGEVAPVSLFGGPSTTPLPTPLPVGPGPHPVKPAPRPLLRVATQRLSAVRRHRRLTATCALSRAGTCRVSAGVTARTARRLHLKVARKARTITLARASRTLKRRGIATLSLRLSKKLTRALGHTRTLTLSITATSSAPGLKPSSVARKVTLKR